MTRQNAKDENDYNDIMMTNNKNDDKDKNDANEDDSDNNDNKNKNNNNLLTNTLEHNYNK